MYVFMYVCLHTFTQVDSDTKHHTYIHTYIHTQRHKHARTPIHTFRAFLLGLAAENPHDRLARLVASISMDDLSLPDSTASA